MLSLSYLLLVLASCCYITNAQVPFPSQCPAVKVVKNFDLDAYMGVWYEYSKYPFVFEVGKKCMYARYGNLGNGTVSVENAAINRFTGTASSVKGTAKVIAAGELAVVFSRNQNSDSPNYLVLGTDYTSYAVVYSCKNFTSIAHTKVVWILARDRLPSDDAINAAKQIMDDNNLSQTFLMTTQQQNCKAPTANEDDATVPLATEENVTAETTTSEILTNVIDKA